MENNFHSVCETTINNSQKNPRNEDWKWRLDNMTWNQRLEEARVWKCFLRNDIIATESSETSPLRERHECVDRLNKGEVGYYGHVFEQHELTEEVREMEHKFHQYVRENNIIQAEKCLKEIQNVRSILKSDRMSWEERMVLVVKFGSFTTDDVRHSRKWNKNPVSERPEFSGIASELSKEAYETSLAFAKHVKEGNIEEAMKCFKQIQDMETITMPTWLDRLHEAKICGHFTDDDVQTCRWFHTNPLMEKCDVNQHFLTLTKGYFTKDAIEKAEDFERYVMEDNVREAEKCLKDIQSHEDMELLRSDDKTWTDRMIDTYGHNYWHKRQVEEAEDLNQGPLSERPEFKGRKVVEADLTDEAIDMSTAFARAVRDNNMMEAESYLRTIQQMKVVLKCL